MRILTRAAAHRPVGAGSGQVEFAAQPDSPRPGETRTWWLRATTTPAGASMRVGPADGLIRGVALRLDADGYGAVPGEPYRLGAGQRLDLRADMIVELFTRDGESSAELSARAAPATPRRPEGGLQVLVCVVGRAHTGCLELGAGDVLVLEGDVPLDTPLRQAGTGPATLVVATLHPTDHCPVRWVP
jgi:hypothetical protein